MPFIRQFAAVLSGVALIALVFPGDAEAARKKQTKRSTVTTSQNAFSGASDARRSAYGLDYPQGGYNRYNMPPGGGINFNDGRLGANWPMGGPP